jgi:hypothetical protein
MSSFLRKFINSNLGFVNVGPTRYNLPKFTKIKLDRQYCHVLEWLDGVLDWISDLLIVTTSNNNSLTELHTLNITETTAHIKSSQSSLNIFW